MKKKPQLYIIAGPNGAGKTTFASQYLPKYVHCPIFVNADEIAARIAKESSGASDFRAGKIFLRKIKELAVKNKNFSFETTLSGRSYIPWLKKLKTSGYSIHLFFLWVPSYKLSLARIEERVKLGGHNIPKDVVMRRFKKALNNFKFYRPYLDKWTFINNDGNIPQMIFSQEGDHLQIVDHDLFRHIQGAL